MSRSRSSAATARSTARTHRGVVCAILRRRLTARRAPRPQVRVGGPMLAACRSRTGSSRAPSNSRWRRRSRSAPGSTHSSNYRLAPERAEAAQSARSSGSSRKPTSKHDSSSPTASPAGRSHCVRQGLQKMQQRGKLNRSANPDRLETATLAGSRAASSPAEPDATQTKPARRRPRRRIRPPTHARGRNNPRRWLDPMDRRSFGG